MTTAATDHGGVSNSLSEWFPLVERTGVPVPETVIFDIPEELVAEFLDERPLSPESREALALVHAEVTRLGDAFLRTDLLSAKHSWLHSCRVNADSNIPAHVFELVMAHAMNMLPRPRNLVVRELLPTTALLIAFDGMPIAAERRYYAKDGVVDDHAPYWPLAALESSAQGNDWRRALALASVESPEEVAELTLLAETASAHLPGAWSLDFLLTTRGWVFIDAAHAEESYVMPEDDRQALVAEASVERRDFDVASIVLPPGFWMDNEYWTTFNGEVIALEELTPQHRENVITHIEFLADAFRAQMVVSARVERLKDGIFEPEWTPEWADVDPLELINVTPLMKRLRELSRTESETS